MGYLDTFFVKDIGGYVEICSDNEDGLNVPIEYSMQNVVLKYWTVMIVQLN